MGQTFAAEDFDRIDIDDGKSMENDVKLDVDATLTNTIKNGDNISNNNNININMDSIEDEPDIKEQKLDDSAIETEKMWIEAIALEPKSSHLRAQLANHYFSQNRLNEAAYTYQQAIRLDSSNVIAYYDYAFMRHHQFYTSLAKLKYVCM